MDFKKDDLRSELLAFVKPIRAAWKQRKVDSNSDYIAYLNEHYPGIPRIQQIYLLETGHRERPSCKVCGGEVSFRFDKGFSETCSKKCMGEYSKQTGRAAEWSETVKKTLFNRFGVVNAFQSREVKEKISQTNQQRYGHKSAAATTSIRDKIVATNLAKYGSREGPVNSQEQKVKNTNNSTHNLEVLANYTVTILSKHPQIQEYLDVYNKAHPNITFICNTCSSTMTTNYMTFLNRSRSFGTPCAVCSGVVDRGSSFGQRSVAEFIRGLGFTVTENDRTIIAPKHLDIVIPECRVCIEYNGLFHHSDRIRSDKNYHVNKLNNANAVGYRLISIFEDEWLHKQDIVKARLRHILGCETRIVHARKCHIVELSVSEARDFIENNHIQGYVGCRYRYGLRSQGQLVSVMTFSLPSVAKGGKHYKEATTELSRYCSIGAVVGGAGRLLSKFCKEHPEVKTIISFADRRWSDGNLYKKLGFSKDHITQPNYWYVRNNKRLHRYALRKTHRDDPSRTERELRESQGYSRIWDCGSLRFSYHNPLYKEPDK